MKLKQYLIAGLFTVGSLLGTSCDSFLDLRPEGEILTEDALRSEADLLQLLNSCYTVLGSGRMYGGRVQIFSELLGDNIDGSTLTGDFGSVYDRRTSIFGQFKNDFYNEPYIAIYRANTTLENLGVAASQATRDRIEGESKFIRAISHFEVVRYFAQPYGYTPDNSHLGVPLRISSTPTASVRATVKEVYDQIVADLLDAERLLPEQNGVYPTRWSAKAILSRVYFQMNDFANAYKYADEVIRSNRFPFDADFSRRFSVGGTPEAVFKLVSDDVNTNRASALIGEFRSDIALPNLRVSAQIFSLGTSNPNDRRRAWYDNVTYSPNIVTTKYNGKDFFDMPVIHITELKLTRAESAAELGTNLNVAIQDLNDIMGRAYGGTRVVAPNTPAGVILATVREERRLELFAEGDRGQQLKRMGARGENIIVRGAPWNCPGAVLQFPQGEMSTSPNFQRNPEGGCGGN